LYGVVPALVCAEVLAQELPEVTVTAQRRTENVQEVPIALTAFTAEALQQKGVTDIHALTNLTPNVNLDAGSPFSGDRSVLSASIRGIGQDDFAFNLNPGVGVYLDGVFLARTIGANQNLLDVDRVEVLKGPQGTLFGANTIGGAISIVTHTPGNETRFIAQVTGGQYNRRDVALTADVPIIKDTLLSSISVSSQNQTGWDKVVPYPTSSLYGQAPFVVDPQNAYPKAAYATSDNYDGTGVLTVRGKLLWNASDKLTFTFTGDWSHEDQTALGYRILNIYTGNLNYSTFSTLYDLCVSNGAAGIGNAIAAAGGPPPFVVAGALSNTPPFNAAPLPNFALGCSSPRAANAQLGSIGGAPLLGAGYVGVPVGVVPSSWMVIWTTTGSFEASRAASRAWRASSKSTIVSMMIRSTPPSTSASICSRKAARASSRDVGPSGSIRTPSGPTAPATQSSLPATSLARRAPARLISRTLSAKSNFARRTRVAPKVFVSRTSAPALT